MKHPEVLKQYKPQIEKMTSDVQFKDSANSILDFIEGRSLAIVTEQVDANTEQLGIVTNDLAETKGNVARIDETVQQHSEDIKDLNTEVTLQREELEVVKAELAEAMIDIERIDRKTVDTTPTWSHDVAKLLDPESNTDWRLLAKRLSYSNDDLKAWTAHHSPLYEYVS
ncbi:hypothetical protein EB796_015297 [Bugula neritina]|uniref:Uncharacterized protein n=1 Tax=Bugula neritina TaxID=10212 RepID=A0A7J7JJA1_BUGNE|nr:hypothetical protein EB796_015297 [Bugula neritina]